MLIRLAFKYYYFLLHNHKYFEIYKIVISPVGSYGRVNLVSRSKLRIQFAGISE
jgi:hypothetical protein